MATLGRPRKHKNCGTPIVSLEDTGAVVLAVESVVNRRIPGLPQNLKAKLIEKLADEMGYLPEMIRLAGESRVKNRGPKWKPGVTVLMKVDIALTSVGIYAPQWKNSISEKNELVDWCVDLTRATKISGIRFSARQAAVAKVEIKRQIPII